MINQQLHQRLAELKKQWDKLHALSEQQQQMVQEKLRLEWIYNSNAIEGNSLTLGETAFYLREGLTAEGKPVNDYLEARNHQEAIEDLQDVISSKTKLTESWLKQLHAVLLKGIEFAWAKSTGGQMVQKPLLAGEYKQQPNHVLTLSGEIHQYVDPLKVPEEMEKLFAWLDAEKGIDVVEKAALLHYRFVKIHPFDDGNGRLARILMNVLLMKAQYPPCVIKVAKRRQYVEALEKADKGEVAVFVDFIKQELIETMEMVISLFK